MSGPLEDAWSDPWARLMLFAMMTPWALIAAAGVVDLARNAWRWM